MSYESPITAIYEQISNQINQDFENRILAEVKMKVDVNINKDELIKALKYDREQYQKGYADAKMDYARPKGEWIYKEFDTISMTQYKCSICNIRSRYRNNFCPNCGADMRKEADNGTHY